MSDALGGLGSSAASAFGGRYGLPPSLTGAAGDYIGRGIGNAVERAGSWFSKLLGFGSYRVRRNSLMPDPAGRPRAHAPDAAGGSGLPTNSPPLFTSTGVGSDVTIAHREFVGNIYSSVGFNARTFHVNPGNPLLHPWLSNLSQLFEEYDLMGMVFEYKSTSAAAVGTLSSGMGVVVMASDYDCYDNNFTSKRSMEAAEFSTSGVPYADQMHPIECDPKRNIVANKYVVPGLVDLASTRGDARLSIHCTTTVATEGQQQDGNAIGELWVTSHYRFSRPILEADTVPQGARLKYHTTTGTGPLLISQAYAGMRPFTLDASGADDNARLHITFPQECMGSTFIISTRSKGPTQYFNPLVKGSLLSGCTFPLLDVTHAGLDSKLDSINVGTLLNTDGTMHGYTHQVAVVAGSGLASVNIPMPYNSATDLNGVVILVCKVTPTTLVAESLEARLDRLQSQLSMLSSQKEEDVGDDSGCPLQIVESQTSTGPTTCIPPVVAQQLLRRKL